MQLEAVKQDGWNIQYIKNPTEKVYLEAIKQKGNIIKYIPKKNQSFDIVQAFFLIMIEINQI